MYIEVKGEKSRPYMVFKFNGFFLFFPLNEPYIASLEFKFCMHIAAFGLKI